MFNKNSEKFFELFISTLLTRIYQENFNFAVCSVTTVYCKEVHMVYECTGTERLRWKLYCDISELDVNATIKLQQLSAEMFYLTVCLFVCLFVCGLTPFLTQFRSYHGGQLT